MQTQISGRCCLLIVVCSVLELYKRFLQIFVGLFLMDCASFLKSLNPNCEFGYGFLVFGCFSQVFNILGLVFMFCLGLKVLQFTCYGNSLVQYLYGNRVKSIDLKNGICSNIGFDQVSDPKFLSLEFKSQKSMNDCLIGKELVNVKKKDVVVEEEDDDDDTKEFYNEDQVCDPKFSSLKFNSLNFKAEKNMSKELVNANIDVKKKDVVVEEEDDGDDVKGFYNEDQEHDVLALKRLVKIERQRAKMVHLELEKERVASASATEEAMAMILRLQREKSSIEIEANQYRRMAEQKHDYDQEVIQSLQWIVMKHESERSELEEHLKLCKQKLKIYLKEDEMDQFEEVYASRSLFFSTMEDGLDDGIIRSLDMDSSDL